MAKILIKFKMSFKEDKSEFSFPIFPNIYCTFIHIGKRKANILNTGYETAKLKVWWEPTLSIFNVLDCNSEVLNFYSDKYFYYDQK